jgi:predicted dinucleotide-binding enzyme
MEGLTALKPEQIRLVDAKALISAANDSEFNGAAEKTKAATQAVQAALQKNQMIVKAFRGPSVEARHRRCHWRRRTG